MTRLYDFYVREEIASFFGLIKPKLKENYHDYNYFYKILLYLFNSIF